VIWYLLFTSNQVITGTVRTNFYKNDVAPQLPESSVYAPVKEVVEQIVSGKEFESMEMDVNEYAEQVVKNVLKSRPTLRQWAGGRVTIMWAIYTFLWATVWVLTASLISAALTDLILGYLIR
jgi:hypothetical protein